MLGHICSTVNKPGADQRMDLLNRFSNEGLDINLLTDVQKLSHVWQWLLDADSNCLSLRRQIDKLHRQHQQDLQEVEEYLEHVWKLSTERLRQLETENKSLKKQILINNNSNETTINKGNPIIIKGKELKPNVDNLCDSLKLKSSLKQIIQNANTDNECDKKLDSINNISHNSNNNNCNNKSNGVNDRTARRRNTVSNLISDTNADNFVINTKNNNNNKNNSKLEDEFQALQMEMCQQFKNIINQLEDKIISLEKSNRNMEIENETLSYKLSESQSQCDQLEHQLLKLSDKRGRQSLSRLSLHTTIPEEEVNNSTAATTTDAEDDPTLGSLQLLLASRIGTDLDHNELNVVKQLHELKSDKQRLEDELNKRNHELKELLQKYEKRKTRHKEMLTRLRTHIERENNYLQQMVQSTDHKYKLAEEELQKHKKYCRISDITAINDME